MASRSGRLREHPFDDAFDLPSSTVATVEDDDNPPEAPADYEAWLRELFPSSVRYPFAEHHHEFWEHTWAIDDEASPDPFVGVWAREGGKSTNVELACTALGVRGRRKYIGYVRRTQKRADDSVTNIATKLESSAVAMYYPAHSRRLLSQYGVSRGWTRTRCRTAGGFTVEAFGLDAAGRGAKLGDQRPDLWVFDDLDEETDDAAATAGKILTLTTSLLPAGSENCGVIAIQNLIIPDGVFTRMVDGRADFLTRRKVSGPHPAIYDLKTTRVEDPTSKTMRDVIVAGRPSWVGMSLVVCQHKIDTWGLSAFKREAQHEVTTLREGVALKVTDAHFEDLTDAQAKALVKRAATSWTLSILGGIDFGSWRFAFGLRVADQDGVLHQIAEYFSQKESLETRARAITAICQFYGVPETICFWGDAANPTDIMELNLAFDRIGSPYRVVAVAMENKVRRPSVDRINDLLDRHALRYRRGVTHAMAPILAAKFPDRAEGEFLSWQLGWNASGRGVQMDGSRLQWELKHWSYPVPKEGEAQEQDPDDDSADGADMIAAERYPIMTWWTAMNPAVERTPGTHPGIDHATGQRLDKGRRVTLSEVMGEQARPAYQPRVAPRQAPMKKVNV